jgi:cysteine desulfuration protein SufE
MAGPCANQERLKFACPLLQPGLCVLGTWRVVLLQADLKELRDEFDLIDDWEDRYRYVIELGRSLPPLEMDLHNAANKVQGCASQVWIASHLMDVDGRTLLTFTGDSDALIVKGLIAIAFRIFSGKTPEEILKIDEKAILSELELKDHLTPQRSNGFVSMIARIKSDARGALQAA